jgi:hypothetical protein
MSRGGEHPAGGHGSGRQRHLVEQSGKARNDSYNMVFTHDNKQTEFIGLNVYWVEF